jgi:hypothetical protein
VNRVSFLVTSFTHGFRFGLLRSAILPTDLAGHVPIAWSRSGGEDMPVAIQKFPR